MTTVFKIIGFIIHLIIVLLVIGAIVYAVTGCCRPATEFQTAKWERKHNFESPRGFWGLHITMPQKKLVYKYRKPK